MTTIIAWTVAGWLAITVVLVAANYRSRRNLARQRAARTAARREPPVTLTHRADTISWDQLAAAIDLARHDFRKSA